jgi:FkbM family methyltransferase
VKPLISVAQDVLEMLPALQKPAHFWFASAQKIRMAVLFLRITTLGHLPWSTSTSGQDRWAIETLRGKRGGYFLDLGAADGFSGNNTYILERYYGWRGLCIEPNPVLFDLMISKYGRRCTCIADLVDDERKSVDYIMTGFESGIVDQDTDNNSQMRGLQLDALRRRGLVKTLRTKTLADVLEEQSAPSVIDYFSFDVEGAETRILRHFPFDRYKFLTLTIERPTPELNALLFRNGYCFVKNSLYDSFYVHRSIPNFDEISMLPFEQVPPKAF